MNYLSIDFETFSIPDIKKAGLYRYIEDDSFDIMCMGYAINGGTSKLWFPGVRWPDDIVEVLQKPFRVFAFNAEFEIRVIEKAYQQFGLAEPIRPGQFIDVQALARTYGFPASLEGVGQALNLGGKTEGGSALVRKLCTPRKPTKADSRTRWTYDMAPDDFNQLYVYCKNDVTLMNRIITALPAHELTPYEQTVWAHTLEQNKRGFPFNPASIESILEAIEAYKGVLNSELVELTNARITKGTQRARILREVQRLGCDIPNLQKETIEDYLEHHTLDPTVQRLLEIRRDQSHTSTGKFKRMQLMMCKDNHIHGLMSYFAQHTGRFGSYGVQIHNQPRAQFKNPEAAIRTFSTRELSHIRRLYPRVMEAATKLIRPMIQAKIYSELAVADYSSIENRIVHWLAADHKTIQEFAEGLDQYRTFAAEWFQTNYLNVTATQRQWAKPSVLSLGFAGAVGALMRAAKAHGVPMTEDEARQIVHFYRKVKYPAVPKMWYTFQNLSVQTVMTGDTHTYKTAGVEIVFDLVKINGTKYFRVKLPSDRWIWYPRPGLEEGKFGGPAINYWGVDGKTKQWSCNTMWYGLLTENIVQAIASDLLKHGLLCAERGGFHVFGSVHDEVISRIKTGSRPIHDLEQLICIPPTWAKTLPLAAKGYLSFYYRKD